MEKFLNDKYGPEMVVKVYDPKIGMEGFLVIDNTALGPGKGGIRMTPNVTEEEVFRLARTMTWKNALAGIPFGGAKAGIKFSPAHQQHLKKDFVQSFARALKLLIPKKYIAGPDINTTETDMKHFAEAVGNWRAATGKPANVCMINLPKAKEKIGKEEGARLGGRCGIPHEVGSTGFGVAQATKVAAKAIGSDIKCMTVAIEGFGNVGTFASQFLHEMGAKIVAVADINGTIYNPEGLDEKKLVHLRAEKKSIMHYPIRNAKKMKHEDIFKVPVDILIPASITDVINDKNKDSIKAKIIVEGANIPMREEVEEYLFKKGILIVPDFIANSGGVISSYAEYRGYNPMRMFDLVERRIVQTASSVLKTSLKKKINPRKVAMEIAVAKVEKKMRERKHTFNSFSRKEISF